MRRDMTDMSRLRIFFAGIWPLPDVADAAEYGLDELSSESRWSLERAPRPPNIDLAFEPERNG
jgi:hypothetical protein